MKIKELLQNIDVKEMNADENMEISGVSYDSRKTKKGDLFVAVVGYASDGHNYIDKAIENGASCILCERVPEQDVPYVLMDDTRMGLALAGANWFGNPSGKMKMVGITGTNGKTTTTTLVKNVIENITGAKVGLIGTNCNMIGSEIIETERTTPESFELQKLFAAMYDAGCEYVVMEVSSHALFLKRVYGINYDVGAFSNLTQDHLDFHKTMEAYGQAKALMFKQSKVGCINADDEYAPMMMSAATCPIFTFSAKNDGADLFAKNIVLSSDSVQFDAVQSGETTKIRLGIPGEFSVYNALAAIAICSQLGFPIEKTAEALSKCSGVKGRAEVVPTNTDYTVLIDYAHTPDAMENILNTVRGFAKGRVVVLFGCGGDRDKTKRPIMGEIGTKMADFAVITSDNPRTEEPMDIIKDILAGVDGRDNFVMIENRREAIKWALDNAKTDDVIILAGKGHEDYQEIGKQKFHFDEREVVKELLESK